MSSLHDPTSCSRIQPLSSTLEPPPPAIEYGLYIQTPARYPVLPHNRSLCPGTFLVVSSRLSQDGRSQFSQLFPEPVSCRAGWLLQLPIRSVCRVLREASCALLLFFPAPWSCFHSPLLSSPPKTLLANDIKTVNDQHASCRGGGDCCNSG